jgi:hypothetical protein
MTNGIIRVVVTLVGFIALTVTLAAPSRASETVARTGIFVLVDTSGTWLSKTYEHENDWVIAQANKAVLDLLGKVETPAAIYVIAIGADSVLEPPMCEAHYRRTLINLGKKGHEFVQRDKLENYLDLCRAAIIKRPISKWTDIHGALELVSRLASSAVFTGRYLLLLSDFKEERPVGPLPNLSLRGFKVALIYRILPEDSRNPKGLEERLAKWRVLTRNAGAANTIEAIDKGRFAGSVVQRLLNNE